MQPAERLVCCSWRAGAGGKEAPPLDARAAENKPNEFAVLTSRSGGPQNWDEGKGVKT